jgi:hypothetical protein
LGLKEGLPRPQRDDFDGYFYYISSVGRVFDMLNNLHVWVFVKWELKKIKTRSQRMTSSGYLKKIQNERIAAGSGYFKKTSQNCRVSRKPGKEEPGRFLGGYFTFTIWDLSFRTSTNKLIEEITRYFTGLSLPHPPKPQLQTQRLTELI